MARRSAAKVTLRRPSRRVAALTVPEAIGERIHLATDNRIRTEDIIRITRGEIGINVRLTDPTRFRNLTLPIVKAALERMNEPKLANALGKLGYRTRQELWNDLKLG